MRVLKDDILVFNAWHYAQGLHFGFKLACGCGWNAAAAKQAAAAHALNSRVSQPRALTESLDQRPYLQTWHAP
jgi:hypothetical protein